MYSEREEKERVTKGVHATLSTGLITDGTSKHAIEPELHPFAVAEVAEPLFAEEAEASACLEPNLRL